MTVTSIRTGPLTSELTAVETAIDAAAAIPPQAVRYADLPNALATVAQLENRLAALKLEVLAEADRRRLAEEEAATGTDAWAARLTGTTRSAMAGGLWLVNLLQSRYHHTREAFAKGQIDPDQVRVIVRAAEKIPAEVPDTVRAEGEYGLVRKAVNGIDAKRLRHHACPMLEAIDKKHADAHEATQLGGEEDRAERETWLMLTDNNDGTFAGRFLIPELHGHLLRNYLERLSAPARWSRNKNGELVDDPTTPGTGPAAPSPNAWVSRSPSCSSTCPTTGSDPWAPTCWSLSTCRHSRRDLATPARHRRKDQPRRGPAPGLQRRNRAGRPRQQVRTARPRP